MLVAEYISNFFSSKNIKIGFGYPGGMITFLMDSLDKNHNFRTYSLYHEQAAAFAACGYTQVSNEPALSYATSGPGATNLITGIAHAYYESIPVIFITGQVHTADSKGTSKIRQKGFQETNVFALTHSITKYSVYVESVDKIQEYLEKAYIEATTGRPGPVLLDIPIDIQRSQINIKSEKLEVIQNHFNYDEEIAYLFEKISMANKPLLILGNGINISDTRDIAYELVKSLKIPVVTSMISVDLLNSDHYLNFGWIGSYGNRHSNLIVSKADLIITFGTRLDIRQTGSNKEEFALNAEIIRFDIDSDELNNKIHLDEVSFNVDIRKFLPNLLNNKKTKQLKKFDGWITECNYYKSRLYGLDDSLPNYYVRNISDFIHDNAIITTDVGQNQVWVAQSFNVKYNQRILFTGGHAPMGYSIPAAIGAHYASNKIVYAFVGDGGLQINIQELQFIYREKLPIKIIVLNNNSLGMIRHFQEMYLENNFSQTVENKGYSAPDFVSIAKAYKIRAININNIKALNKIRKMLHDDLPLLINIFVGKTTYTYPKLGYNKPIYDQEPPLDRELLDELLNYKEGKNE